MHTLHIYQSYVHKIPPFLLHHTRYELAQQLQPQSTEDPLPGTAVVHEMQVEIEADSLPQPPATSTDQQSMLGLGQTEVVNGSQQVTLEGPLTDQALVQGEGTYDPEIYLPRPRLSAFSVLWLDFQNQQSTSFKMHILHSGSVFLTSAMYF